jgi:hypothetical protein
MLKKLGFGRDKAPALAQTAPSLPDPAIEAQKILARHREMVRLTVKGTLNEYGLGATWVGSEVSFTVPPSAAAPSETDQTANTAAMDVLTIRLIVQEWREELLRYLPALQQKIVASLGRVQPAINHSRHSVSWQFAPDCGCTVNDLPPAASWAAKAAVRAGPGSRRPAPAQSNAPGAITAKFDLPPSDLDHAWRDHDDPIPSSFAASQPGFLNSQPEFQNTEPFKATLNKGRQTTILGA